MPGIGSADCAKYIQVIRNRDAVKRQEVIEAYQHFSKKLSSVYGLFKAGLILHFPSVLARHLSELPKLLHESHKHVLGDTKLPAAYAKLSFTLTRQLTLEKETQVLGCQHDDSKAQLASSTLLQPFGNVRIKQLLRMQERLLGAIAKQDPLFAKHYAQLLDKTSSLYQEADLTSAGQTEESSLAAPAA